jgi:hypothetical protein
MQYRQAVKLISPCNCLNEDVHMAQQLRDNVSSIPCRLHLPDLRGQAFSVKTFLISDMFLLCKLNEAGVNLKDGRAIVTAGFKSRIAMRCMGAVDCLW